MSSSSLPHVGLVAIGGQGWMGGAHYVRNLAAALHAARPEGKITWVCGESLLPEWGDATPCLPVPAPSRWQRWRDGGASAFRQRLEEAGIEFLYPLTYDNEYNLHRPFPLSPALGACRWAGWIPDFQHRYLPELFTPQELRWRDTQMAKLAAEAPRVFLSSQTALADFTSFFPQHAAKATLLQFRAQPIAPVDARMPTAGPERFFLVCNQFWRHKNHGIIFEALHILRQRGVQPLVLCTGALSDYRSDPYAAELRDKLAEYHLEEQVTLLGLVPRSEQVKLLRRTIAVIQPSLFEGWSTVVEDTRVLGRPCLLSDLPVHHEQNPPGAHFYPRQSAEVLAELMDTAWQEWPAGPDSAREHAAWETAKAQQREFGERFWELAMS